MPAGVPPLGASRTVSDSPKTTNARTMPQPMRVSASGQGRGAASAARCRPNLERGCESLE
eukprot:scaffold3922_cov42-Phaeocystis_antarctica.AAC.1